jgi:hypothetical protein
MICEKCGKEHNGTFGSGRFCSRSCANGHIHSEECKLHIGNGVKNSEKYKKGMNKRFPDPVFIKISCKQCGKIIRQSKYGYGLCQNCYDKSEMKRLTAIKSLKIAKENGKNIGGLRKGSGVGIKGWYKGFYCRSTWELAWLIYQLDHGIEVKQCKECFEYKVNGEIHKYYSDFIINGEYVEIKGRRLGYVQEKIDQFPKGKKLILIEGKKEIKPYLSYVKEKYNIDNIKNIKLLYEDTKQKMDEINKRKEEILLKKQKLIEEKKNILLNSGIDFTKLGWLKLTMQLLNTNNHRQIKKFIDKYLPEIKYKNRKCK